MNVEIRELDESYKGKKFLFQYETTHYFDIEATEKEEEWGLRFIKKSFEKAIQKKFESVLLEDFLEDPMLLGAFKQDKLVGFIELSHEKWNNRLRISNIFVEKPYRYQGIGKILISRLLMNWTRSMIHGLLLLNITECGIQHLFLEVRSQEDGRYTSL